MAQANLRAKAAGSNPPEVLRAHFPSRSRLRRSHGQKEELAGGVRASRDAKHEETGGAGGGHRNRDPERATARVGLRFRQAGKAAAARRLRRRMADVRRQGVRDRGGHEERICRAVSVPSCSRSGSWATTPSSIQRASSGFAIARWAADSTAKSRPTKPTCTHFHPAPPLLRGLLRSPVVGPQAQPGGGRGAPERRPAACERDRPERRVPLRGHKARLLLVVPLGLGPGQVFQIQLPPVQPVMAAAAVVVVQPVVEAQVVNAQVL